MNIMNNKRWGRWVVLAGASLGMGCGPEMPVPAPERTVLRVPLYSYIPDAAGDKFRGLSARIESEFEAEHPEVDLVVNPPCFQDDLYEPAQPARSLKGEGHPPLRRNRGGRGAAGAGWAPGHEPGELLGREGAGNVDALTIECVARIVQPPQARSSSAGERSFPLMPPVYSSVSENSRKAGPL